MDVRDVEKLAKSGESLTVEFKRRRDKSEFSAREAVRMAVCLANGSGGTILVGVDDDGAITGAIDLFEDGSPNYHLENFLRAHTTPPIDVHVEEVRVPVEGEDRLVIVVSVEASPMPVATKDGLYVYRTLDAQGQPECQPMDPAYLFTRYREARHIDPMTAPAEGTTISDLDPLEIERYRRLIVANRADENVSTLDNAALVRALGFYPDDDGPVALGAIALFGTAQSIARHLPMHEVRFSVLGGTRVRENYSTSAPLVAAYEDIAARIDKYRSEEELQLGLVRLGFTNLPVRAVREGLANALIHRDYFALGAVTVQLAESLTISSPGGLPRGVNVDNIFVQSIPRSPLLADAFKRAGLVECTGRGVQIMAEELLLNGRGEPDYSATTGRSVTVSLPILATAVESAYVLRAWMGDNGELPLTAIRAIHLVAMEGEKSMADIQRDLSLSRHTVQSACVELERTGLLARGRTLYRLGPTYTALMPRRQAGGSDRIEDAISDLLSSHDTVTTSAVMAAAGVTRAQATRALGKMVEAGELVRHGTTRDVYYTRVVKA